MNVAVTIIAVKYMDKAGRKSLLTTSWIGLFFSYTILTMSFILKPYVGFMDKVSECILLCKSMQTTTIHSIVCSLLHQLSVAATIGVIIFFAFGPGCIAWFIIAEIFPLYARDTAMAV